MKRTIRLTESDLRNIVRKSVGKILREFGSDGPDFADYEVPGYEGTNVPDGVGYSELDADEDFDDFLSDSQYVNQPNIGRHAQSASDFDTDDALLDVSSNYDEYGGPRRFGESKKSLGRIIRESINKVLNEAEVYPGFNSTTTADIASNGDSNIITCYGSPGAISGKFRGVGTILGPGVIYLACNPPTNGMKSMYGQFVPVKVDVSNFYRAKDAWEAKKLIGLVGFKDEYSGILYHSNRDGDVCAVFDRSCIIG